MVTAPSLTTLIDMAAGRKPADLLITNGRIVDVFSREIVAGSLAIGNGKILGIGEYEAQVTVDAKGLYILPGLIDAHVHIESSLLTPRFFAQTVLPFGTTTVVADPHEIANVLGLDGIRFMIEDARNLPLTVYYMLPSCVPASPFESSGAVLGAAALAELIDEKMVLGIGEAMNFPGVVNNDPGMQAKLLLGLNGGKIIDGHSPTLGGRELNAYAAAGIKTDHECSTVAEMQARIRNGMYVHLREGSAARNLATLIKGVTAAISRRCTFCTDDREPDDITSRGHINGILRQAVAEGIDPVLAITMATLNPAECYGLKTKGALAPGYDADFIMVEDLENFAVKSVFTAGREVAAQGGIVAGTFTGAPSGSAPSVHLGPVGIDSFRLPCSSTKVPVIGLIPGNIFTRKVIRDVMLDGEQLFRVANNPGLTKLAVVERHRATGRVGVGILENYGITNGAIATTIAHDAHNIVVAGDNDGDMLAAVQAIAELGGGIVLCREGRVVESLALPVAGLMCEKMAEEVGGVLQRMISLAHDGFNVNAAIQPFMTLSFMSLSVIPELKLTDQGLLDVNTFTLCSS